MKPIKLTKKEKEEFIKDALKELVEKVDEYEYSSTSTSFKYEKSFNKESKEKIQIIYEPFTFMKMSALVKEFSSEIGWYGLVKKIGDKAYYVYDVKICHQQVSGVRVIDESPDNQFYEDLGDDIDYLHFQAHSHVNMPTGPSGTDTDNQVNTVQNLGGTGFFIFQIWNKSGDINTFLYDLDENLMYDRNDVDIIIADDQMSLDEFIEDAKSLVTSITYKPAETTWGKPKEYSKYEERSGFYWNDGMGQHGFE